MRIRTYREFWPYYLREHSHPWTKRLHIVGTVLGVVIAVRYHVLAGIMLAYALAWTSHFLIEKNKPATFRYPVWSFFSDFRMLFGYVTGKIR